MLGLEWKERCRLTANVIHVAMKVCQPVYFTQLEEIFGSCQMYSVQDLVKHSSQNETVAGKSADVHSCVPVEVGASDEEKAQDSGSTDIVKSKDESSSASSLVASVSSDFFDSTKHSPEDLCSNLESFFDKRDIVSETKLRELFDMLQTSTAKENLLLSLR